LRGAWRDAPINGKIALSNKNGHAMNRRTASFGRLALAAFACLTCCLAAAAEEGPASNVYVAGAEVRIDAAVPGDLVAAAGRISVDKPVAGDAVLAAGALEVNSPIGDDLRAAGGIITLANAVYGEALIAAGKISVGPEAWIHGRAWLAGNDLVIGGRLLGGLKAYGRNLLLLGEIRGPVDLSGEQIEILSSARIDGDVTYSSHREIRIAPGARIMGTITRASNTFSFPRPKLRIPGLPAIKPLLLFGLLAAGTLLLALFPRFTSSSVLTLNATPLKSLGLGTAIFFSLPPVMLLLVITIIGIPVALLLAAVYAVALLIGYLITAFFIGERLVRLARRPAPAFWLRIVCLGVALLLLWLLNNIPYAGGLAVLVALWLGIGAMVLQAFSNYAKQG
jgi:hypothetical protein